LEEELQETLTPQWLGINKPLRESPASTTLIKSCFARSKDRTRRVKRWRTGRTVMRWAAAAFLAAKAGLRRIKGYAHLPQLKAALVAQQHSELETNQQAA
jgi:hypothetical protein